MSWQKELDELRQRERDAQQDSVVAGQERQGPPLDLGQLDPAAKITPQQA